MTRGAYLLLTALVLVPADVLGQAPTGAVSGTVTDSSGSALRDASVIARRPDTGSQRSVMTDDRGHYLLTSLLPGPTSFERNAAGFRTRTGW